MEDFIYDIRWDEDEREWRAQARRELAVSLFRRYRPNSGCANRVLDIGCGTGVLVKEMSVLGDAYGVDTSAKAVAYSRRRGLSSTAVGTADALCFTAVVCRGRSGDMGDLSAHQSLQPERPH